MKLLIICLALVLLSSMAYAGSYDRYEIKQDPYGTSYGGSTNVEMNKKYDYDPSNKYRGEIDKGGDVSMHNYNGDRLRGHIDSDGYGKLHDQDGNTYRVKPY